MLGETRIAKICKNQNQNFTYDKRKRTRNERDPFDVPSLEESLMKNDVKFLKRGQGWKARVV